jgi:uncharacterized protein
MIRSTLAIALIAVAGVANAAGSTTTPAKQELVQRVLQLWQLDSIGQNMLSEPVTEAVGQARAMLQGRAPVEKRDVAMREIAADAKKFIEDTSPMVRTSAQKLIPTTVAPMLAEKFTEDELRQIIAILESPVKKKFESMVPDMQKALGEKLAADTRPAIDPRLEDLRQRIGMRLRTAIMP